MEETMRDYSDFTLEDVEAAVSSFRKPYDATRDATYAATYAATHDATTDATREATNAEA